MTISAWVKQLMLDAVIAAELVAAYRSNSGG